MQRGRAPPLGRYALVPVLLALHGAPASAQALTIAVSDPKIVALVLECNDGAHKLVVQDGKATLDRRPQACTVNHIVEAGTIDQPGEWTCSLEGCTQEDVSHLEVSDSPGRINIIAAELSAGSWFELTCPSGYRERARITENTGVFNSVPDEPCTLHFKGGAPAKFSPIRWGTHQCLLSSSTAICTQR